MSRRCAGPLGRSIPVDPTRQLYARTCRGEHLCKFACRVGEFACRVGEFACRGREFACQGGEFASHSDRSPLTSTMVPLTSTLVPLTSTTDPPTRYPHAFGSRRWVPPYPAPR
eukprot:6466800-Pyramimonas_sp.AAC.1